jgi:hypothetical protein
MQGTDIDDGGVDYTPPIQIINNIENNIDNHNDINNDNLNIDAMNNDVYDDNNNNDDAYFDAEDRKYDNTVDDTNYCEQITLETLRDNMVADNTSKPYI